MKPLRYLLTLTLMTFCYITFVPPSLAQETKLEDKQEAIIPIAAFTANGDVDLLKTALNEGLDAGMTINEVREVLIQMYAYTGFPRSLNGLTAFSEVLKERKDAGMTDVVGKDATPLSDEYDPNAKGNKTRNELVGRDMTVNRAAYAQLAPVIDVYLKEHLFGDIFARDVLSYQERELATISALAAMEGTNAQLNGHLNVSLNTGLTMSQLEHFASVLRQEVNPIAADKTISLLEQMPGYSSKKPSFEKAIKVVKQDEVESTNGSPANFTGSVTVDSRFVSEANNGYYGAMVNFETGARTAWHTHPLGQTLVIISGTGRVQSEGEEVQTVSAGDVVWIPASEKHWHGASSTSPMSHIAIVQPLEGEGVNWMEKVTNEEFNGE